MSAVEVAASNWTRAGRTCSPAMGFSFAGGTTDGVPPSGALRAGGCSQLCDKHRLAYNSCSLFLLVFLPVFLRNFAHRLQLETLMVVQHKLFRLVQVRRTVASGPLLHILLHSTTSGLARGAGPGAFDFRQGDTNGTAFWRLVRHFIHEPSAAQAACHAPKPILLDTGSLTIPYAWCGALRRSAFPLAPRSVYQR